MPDFPLKDLPRLPGIPAPWDIFGGGAQERERSQQQAAGSLPEKVGSSFDPLASGGVELGAGVHDSSAYRLSQEEVERVAQQVYGIIEQRLNMEKEMRGL
jgi:hypothetical protein